MLNILQDGSITLTIHGKIIAQVDPIAAGSMSAIDLVIFENNARFDYYERDSGFYSLKNQHECREVKLSQAEKHGFPIEPEDVFTFFWEKKRRNAIDT